MWPGDRDKAPMMLVGEDDPFAPHFLVQWIAKLTGVTSILVLDVDGHKSR